MCTLHLSECAQSLGINLAPAPSLMPRMRGASSWCYHSNGWVWEHIACSKGFLWLTCIGGKCGVDSHNSVFWTFHLYSREFGECNLHHIFKKNHIKENAGFCYYFHKIVFTSGNRAEIGLIEVRSREWVAGPPTGSSGYIGRRKKRMGPAINRCGVTVGKG